MKFVETVYEGPCEDGVTTPAYLPSRRHLRSAFLIQFGAGM